MIPQIVFKELELQDNIDFIKWAYFESAGGLLNVHDYTIKTFPELKNLNEIKDKEYIYKTIEDVVKKNYEKNYKKIMSCIDRYKRIRDNYNDIYFNN